MTHLVFIECLQNACQGVKCFKLEEDGMNEAWFLLLPHLKSSETGFQEKVMQKSGTKINLT